MKHVPAPRLPIFAIWMLAALAGCNVAESVREFRETTPHERYSQNLRDAGLAQSAMGREWLMAADTVLHHAHRVTLPLNETGYYDRGQARAVGWEFDVRDGQQISIALSVDGQPAQIFTDLFVVTTDSVRRFESVASGVTDSTQQSLLRYETRDSVTLVLRVQPELLRGGRYTITIRSDPVLAFPVEGRGNSAAQSFWGVDRDGGRRSHKGVDIFAPRGTPVLAATDGRITSISPNNLGGNVIWQSDDRRSQTLYYAHLDRHYVTAGVHVKAGDTIGFVGNTGNARTTSPHLHFGIYRRGRGPIDPWPYVRRVTATFAPIRADTSRMGSRVQLRDRSLALRVAPAPKADSISMITRADTMQVVGAAAGFYRVELASGVAGYVPASGGWREVRDGVRVTGGAGAARGR
jgi:peptidoglycan LD-endopeptidase LytH